MISVQHPPPPLNTTTTTPRIKYALLFMPSDGLDIPHKVITSYAKGFLVRLSLDWFIIHYLLIAFIFLEPQSSATVKPNKSVISTKT